MTDTMNTVVLLGVTIGIPSIVCAIKMAFEEAKSKNRILRSRIDKLLEDKYNVPDTCILSPKLDGGKTLLKDVNGNLYFSNENPIFISIDKNESFAVQLYIENK